MNFPSSLSGMEPFLPTGLREGLCFYGIVRRLGLTLGAVEGGLVVPLKAR